MTLKQYNFAKNARIVGITIGFAYLVFGAGAVFTGYEPALPDYAVLVIVILNLINAVVNKPTPPPTIQN